MDRPLPDISTLRPAGGKRSSKRDRILNIFMRQEGHLSADDLCDLVRKEDPGIGRATVYRTLQWMVDAGVARKVDFGEGRSRFEPSYRHPRHFHLVCNTCHRSSEFLSSDIEAAGRGSRRGARLHDHPDASSRCSAHARSAAPDRRSPTLDGAITERVFARDAMRIAIATERSGLEFYTRAAGMTSDPRGRAVFQRLAEEEKEHLGTLERRYAQLLAAGSGARDASDVPLLQGRGERSLRRRRRSSSARRQRSAGAAHRHPLRARLAQVLQAIRRAVRGLRGQADLPRVRR